MDKDEILNRLNSLVGELIDIGCEVKLTLMYPDKSLTVIVPDATLDKRHQITWKELFELKEPPPPLGQHIKQMHSMYGVKPGKWCKTCAHLIRYHGGSRAYLKCDLTRISNSAATDWRAGNPACGKHRERTDQDG